jgi:hypothetical protein
VTIDGGSCEVADDGSVECEPSSIKYSSTPYICNLPYRSKAKLEVRAEQQGTLRQWGTQPPWLVCGRLWQQGPAVWAVMLQDSSESKMGDRSWQ